MKTLKSLLKELDKLNISDDRYIFVMMNNINRYYTIPENDFTEILTNEILIKLNNKEQSNNMRKRDFFNAIVKLLPEKDFNVHKISSLKGKKYDKSGRCAKYT